VLLYELLTGHRPFDIGRGSPLEIERAICTTDPVQPSTVVSRTASRTAADGSIETVTPVDVSAHRATDPPRLRRHLAGDLDNIVMVALRKEPGRRYASAAALAEDIRRHLTAMPVSARPDTIRYRSAKFVRRNAGAVVAASAIVLALVASTVVTLVQARRVAQERDVAVEERAKAVEVRSFLLEMFGGVGEETVADSLTARQLLDLQAARIDDAYADRPALRAEMMHVLAEGYERLALFSIADTLARRALELRRDEYGPVHPDVAASLGQVGWLQHQLGHLRDAVPFLEQSITIRRGLGESQRLELSRSLNDLGIVLDNLGERDRAEPLLEEALDIRLSMNGPLHRSVGVTANNLASVRYRKGNVEEAIRYQRQSVDALRASVGPDHQRSVVAQQNLAMYMVDQGDLDGAEQLLRDLLDRQTRLQGADHPVTALVMTNLGDVLSDLGRNDEAEPLLRQALAIREERLGPDHVDVGIALAVLARFLVKTGRREEAIPAFERVLAINRATLGEGHLNLGATHAELAAVFDLAGRRGRPSTTHRCAHPVRPVPHRPRPARRGVAAP
jgi:serine/threonine-protein kinase